MFAYDGITRSFQSTCSDRSLNFYLILIRLVLKCVFSGMSALLDIQFGAIVFNHIEIGSFLHCNHSKLNLFIISNLMKLL
jgi:hypothetical protein